MNKDLFKIDSDEVRRILSLHEERTKTQYLNIILEQNYTVPKYVLKMDQLFKNNDLSGGNQYYLLQGTEFKSTSDPSIVKATNVKVNKMGGTGIDRFERDKNHDVLYYCKQGLFYFSGDKKRRGYTNQTVANNLKGLCGKVNYESEIAKKGKTAKISMEGFFVDPKFTNSLAFSIVKNSTWTWDGKKAITPNKMSGGITTSGIGQATEFAGQSVTSPIFTCTPDKTGSYIKVNNKGFIESTSGQPYTKQLRKQFCFSNKNQPDVSQSNQNNNVNNKPPKSNFKAIYTIQNKHDLGTKQINVGDIIIKSFKFPDYAGIMRGNTAIAYFDCKTNTWTDKTITDTKGALTGTIKQKVCPQVVSSSASTVSTSANTQTNDTGGTNTGGTNTGGTNTGGGSNRQSRFITNTQTKINNVQKLLGVTPTGQLDTTQIDTLINKLKGQ